MSEPIRFVFAVHVHQPVGNFDDVFREHVEKVYQPLLAALAEHDIAPVALHLSGPLIEWLDRHDTAVIDAIGRGVADDRFELLLSGYYEPILASIPRPDRLEQIAWMRELLVQRFGASSSGLWLTERVWEPSLVADLADAGIEYVFLDDRHFLVAGLEREALHAPYRTEFDGRTLTVLPIDERLRYLIPFRPVEETFDYLDGLRRRGQALAVLGDDGEKFGGWPGTYEWVHEQGWLRRFLTTLANAAATGDVTLTAPRDAVREVPSAGLAYLPSASYREMEGWALPAPAAIRLRAVEHEFGEERLKAADGALIRGGHWRGFLAKYSEANRMHKKMTHLSALCRAAGNPPDARRAVGHAQCNDAYWHGVFGGLYLPHLRQAVWLWLARAEGLLRAGTSLQYDVLDFDADGHDEIWVHSSTFSALIAPARGGAIEELTVFERGVNYADVLTRRREAYHEPTLAEPEPDTGGAPSIHDIERSTASAPPPIDVDERGLFVDRILDPLYDLSGLEAGHTAGIQTLRTRRYRWEVDHAGDTLTISLHSDDHGALAKSYRITADGRVTVRYTWRPDDWPAGSRFTTELSVSRALTVATSGVAEQREYPITTLVRWEGGLEETQQGVASVFAWPIARRQAEVVISL